MHLPHHLAPSGTVLTPEPVLQAELAARQCWQRMALLPSPKSTRTCTLPLEGKIHWTSPGTVATRAPSAAGACAADAAAAPALSVAATAETAGGVSAFDEEEEEELDEEEEEEDEDDEALRFALPGCGRFATQALARSLSHCFLLYANKGTFVPEGFFAAYLDTLSSKATSSASRAACSHGRSFLTTAAPRRPLPTTATEDIAPTASAIKPLAFPAELAEAATWYLRRTLPAFRVLLSSCILAASVCTKASLLPSPRTPAKRNVQRCVNVVVVGPVMLLYRYFKQPTLSQGASVLPTRRQRQNQALT